MLPLNPAAESRFVEFDRILTFVEEVTEVFSRVLVTAFTALIVPEIPAVVVV